jgi:hypothetical protein
MITDGDDCKDYMPKMNHELRIQALERRLIELAGVLNTKADRAGVETVNDKELLKRYVGELTNTLARLIEHFKI